MLVHGGIVIREMRKKIGYTQLELAVSYGVGLSTISKWERKIHDPSFMEVFSVGKHLKYSVEDIYKMTNDIVNCNYLDNAA